MTGYRVLRRKWREGGKGEGLFHLWPESWQDPAVGVVHGTGCLDTDVYQECAVGVYFYRTLQTAIDKAERNHEGDSRDYVFPLFETYEVWEVETVGAVVEPFDFTGMRISEKVRAQGVRYVRKVWASSVL